MMAVASRADAFVYWANAGTGSIGRAGLDGLNPLPTFVGVPAAGVAVSNRFIYYTNYNGNTIGRLNSDGSNNVSNFIIGAAGPSGVAINRNYIYWANQSGGTIGRANIGDPSSANQSFITGADSPTAVAVDRAHVYWANNASNSIGRAPITGVPSSDVNQSFITGATRPVRGGGRRRPRSTGRMHSRGHDRARRHQRRSDHREPELHHRCRLPRPGWRSTPRHIYWANFPDKFNTIGRADICDGSTTVNQNFITGAHGPTGVAVDAKAATCAGTRRRRSPAPGGPTS